MYAVGAEYTHSTLKSTVTCYSYSSTASYDTHIACSRNLDVYDAHIVFFDTIIGCWEEDIGVKLEDHPCGTS